MEIRIAKQLWHHRNSEITVNIQWNVSNINNIKLMIKSLVKKKPQIDQWTKKCVPFLWDLAHASSEEYQEIDPEARHRTQRACRRRKLSRGPKASAGHQWMPSSPNFLPSRLALFLPIQYIFCEYDCRFFTIESIKMMRKKKKSDNDHKQNAPYMNVGIRLAKQMAKAAFSCKLNWGAKTKMHYEKWKWSVIDYEGVPEFGILGVEGDQTVRQYRERKCARERERERGGWRGRGKVCVCVYFAIQRLRPLYVFIGKDFACLFFVRNKINSATNWNRNSICSSSVTTSFKCSFFFNIRWNTILNTRIRPLSLRKTWSLIHRHFRKRKSHPREPEWTVKMFEVVNSVLLQFIFF